MAMERFVSGVVMCSWATWTCPIKPKRLWMQMAGCTQVTSENTTRMTSCLSPDALKVMTINRKQIKCFLLLTGTETTEQLHFERFLNIKWPQISMGFSLVHLMKFMFVSQNWSSQLEVKIFPRCPLRMQLKKPFRSSAMPCLSETRESSSPCCSPLRYQYRADDPNMCQG